MDIRGQGLDVRNQRLDAENDGFGVKNDGFGAENQGFDVKNDGLDVRNQGLDAENDGFDVKNQGFGAENHGLDDKNQGFDVKNDGLSEKNQGFGVKNDGLSEKNQGFGVKNQDLDAENQSKGEKAGDSEGESEEELKKPVPMRKIPKVFRKKYTERAIEKRLLKKIYIDSDRKLVKSLFTEKAVRGKKEFYSVDLGREIEKRDLRQLKAIAKAIKKNKVRVKFAPLIAAVASVAFVCIVVSIFKNPIAKKIIKSGCEAVFEAKTDIRSVNVELLGISLKVRGLEIGDKNSKEYGYKKNLFEAEDITLDMDFTQALRGKAIINEISVTGMKFGTDRQNSCYIPPKERFRNRVADSAFARELKSRSDKALDDLRAQAESILGGGSVDEIVGNIQSQLKTPEAARKAEGDVQALIEKWQARPEELKDQVGTFSESVKDVRDFDINSLKSGSEAERIQKLKELLAGVNSAIQTGTELKEKFEKTAGEVKADSKASAQIAESVAEAIRSDKALAEGIVSNAVDTVKNARQILTNALNTVGYDMLGKYYPYVQQGVAYAMQMKANSKAEDAAKSDGKKEKKAKEEKSAKRLPGTTLWFSRNYPGLWIKNVAASGYTENDSSRGFSGAIRNITSNQNVTGLPTTAEAEFDAGKVNHSGKIVLDVRKETDDDLISVDYTGRGFSANVDGAKISRASGVPSIGGTMTLTLSGAAGGDGFSVGGSVDVNPATLTSDGFPNELATKYYQAALSAIDRLQVGYKAGYRSASGLSLDLSGNFAEQFSNALRAALSSAMSDAKEAAIKKINEMVNGADGEVALKVKEFLGIEGEIDVQNANLDTVMAALESKRKEIEEQISGKIDEAKSQAQEKANEKIDTAKEKANEKIKSGAAGLLNKVKR